MIELIYLYTALYPEAKPLIAHFKLKKQQPAFGFDYYENEHIRLVLTGAGAWAAATAVGSSLGFYSVQKEDLLLNWGSCGADADIGTVYRCNKLVDGVWGRTYYPDLIYGSSLPEACVVTEPFIWKTDGERSVLAEEGVLHDMEAAAIYFAGSWFLAPHQMLFYKAVTDQGSQAPTSGELSRIMEKAGQRMIHEAEGLLEFQKSRAKERRDALAGTAWLERLYGELHCSQTMKAALSQCVRYWMLAGIDYQSELAAMREAGLLPCKDRREGKKRLEQLRARLL